MPPTAAIDAQLESLRRRIRTYVWCEGIAIGLVWLCLTFWAGLALDYLPVRLGGSEMPRGARFVLLILISGVLLLITYRWIVRRAFVPLRDASLALLIERAYPEFDDGLVTVVELADDLAVDGATDVSRPLYDQTVAQAVRGVGHLRLSRVFNARPLLRAGLTACVLLISVVGFAVASQSSFALWCKRLYGLSSETYPRQTLLEMVGWQGTQTVPRGSDFTLRVRADASRPVPPPEICTVHYTTADGDRGRVNMSRIGQARDGFQYYSYEGKPFRGVLTDIDFDVVGNDFRLKDQRLRVAERPRVVRLEVAMQLPAYTGLLPRIEAYRPGLQVPQGSGLEITIKTSKPLTHVAIEDERLGEAVEYSSDWEQTRDTIVYTLEAVGESFVHEITIVDDEGIANEKPYRVDIAVVPDMPPSINSRLPGIGSAVTVDARIPILAELSDDFGVERAWSELVTAEPATREIPVVPDTGGEVNAVVDLRELQRDPDQPLKLEPESKLTLTVMGLDACDVGSGPHLGQGPTTELEVVTPNRLMALLEARELGLRRRLEQIITESHETRDSLARVQFDMPGVEEENRRNETGRSLSRDSVEGEGPTEDEDAVERMASGEPVSERDRARALRLLRVQRSKQQVDRCAAEVLGISMSFSDIRLELINNRVDSAERQNRIERDIATPLKRLAEGPIPDLSTRLKELERSLAEATQAVVLKRVALEELDRVILALERVLEKMLDLETFSELVDLVNSLIRDQEALLEQTKKERKKRALELLK